MEHDYDEPSHDGFSAEDLEIVQRTSWNYIGDTKSYVRFECNNCERSHYTLFKNGHFYNYNHRKWERIER